MKTNQVTPYKLVSKWLREAKKNELPLFRYDAIISPAIKESFVSPTDGSVVTEVSNTAMVLHAPNEDCAKEFIKLQMHNLYGVEVEVVELKAISYWFPHKADGVTHQLADPITALADKEVYERKVSKS